MTFNTRYQSPDDTGEIHEINVTPFIDVVLVLLIVFMVAAPLSTVDIAVDLPPSSAAPSPRPDKPTFITLKSDLSLSLGDMPVERASLAARLDDLTGGDRERRIFLRADRQVDYGDLIDAMDLLRQAGYLKVALVGLEKPPGEDAAKTP